MVVLRALCSLMRESGDGEGREEEGGGGTVECGMW